MFDQGPDEPSLTGVLALFSIWSDLMVDQLPNPGYSMACRFVAGYQGCWYEPRDWIYEMCERYDWKVGDDEVIAPWHSPIPCADHGEVLRASLDSVVEDLEDHTIRYQEDDIGAHIWFDETAYKSLFPKRSEVSKSA